MRRIRHSAKGLSLPLTERAGFIAFYERESEMVLMFCTRRVFDAEVALDLTAETFAQAYRGRRGFRGSSEAEARGWLLTIARRQLARFIERGQMDREAVRRLGLEVPALEPEEIAEVERRSGLHELRRVVGSELARLNDAQRQALQLRIVEERSYEEIARVVGVSEQTVRARVSRGLRALATSAEVQALNEASCR